MWLKKSTYQIFLVQLQATEGFEGATEQYPKFLILHQLSLQCHSISQMESGNNKKKIVVSMYPLDH